MRGRPVSSWRRAYRLGFALLQTTCQTLHPTSRKCPRFGLGCHLCAPNVIGDMYVSKTSGASRLAGKRYLVACSIHLSLPGRHRSSAADAMAVIWGIPVGWLSALLAFSIYVLVSIAIVVLYPPAAALLHRVRQRGQAQALNPIADLNI